MRRTQRQPRPRAIVELPAEWFDTVRHQVVTHREPCVPTPIGGGRRYRTTGDCELGGCLTEALSHVQRVVPVERSDEHRFPYR